MGHSYWPCTQRSNKHKCKHAFTHTHTQNVRLFSLCFPCNAPDHTSSAYWKYSVAPICFASLYLRFWVMGNPCHKGAALVLPAFLPPGGGSLSHEYPFTGATLLTTVNPSSGLNFTCHSNWPHPYQPLPEKPPVVKTTSCSHFYCLSVKKQKRTLAFF